MRRVGQEKGLGKGEKRGMCGVYESRSIQSNYAS